MTLRKRILKMHPAAIVMGSFLLAIVMGTLVLKLPVATETRAIPWLDALFTATSAVCVTGLIVVDTGSYFTTFGQCVILALIQIGGIGVMTVSVALFQWIGKSVSMRDRLVMQDIFAHTPRKDIFGLVRSVFLFTLVAEFIGAVFLTIHWMREIPFTSALYTGVFHSVSAFCNAGFALYPDSMMGYSGSLALNMTMGGLIVLGGIGFPVLYDMKYWWMNKKRERVRLSVQTKTVLLTTVILILAGAFVFGLLEGQALEGRPFSQRVLIPLFQSITCRTAGFNTVDIASLRDATLTLILFLMFFGASPGSCGGGVKTTTLALIFAITVSRIRKKRHVNIFKKSIPNETLTRSVSLIVISTSLIGVVLFMLLAGNSTGDARGFFLASLFETVSAFGTVGLSMGLTPDLNAWGKWWIIMMMLIGRVGVLTFAYIIVGTGTTKGLEYSEENIMVG